MYNLFFLPSYSYMFFILLYSYLSLCPMSSPPEKMEDLGGRWIFLLVKNWGPREKLETNSVKAPLMTLRYGALSIGGL